MDNGDGQWGPRTGTASRTRVIRPTRWVRMPGTWTNTMGTQNEDITQIEDNDADKVDEDNRDG